MDQNEIGQILQEVLQEHEVNTFAPTVPVLLFALGILLIMPDWFLFLNHLRFRELVSNDRNNNITVQNKEEIQTIWEENMPAL